MDRTKEAFEFFHQNNKDLEQNEYLTLLKQTFGNPPYEFLDEGQIPKYSIYRKKALTLPEEYKAKYPHPNYSNFGKPEYIDSEGRHYKLAKGSVKEKLVNEGEIVNTEFKSPDIYKPRSYGKQVFWIKIPISLRGSANFPNPESNEQIVMYHVDTGTKCTAYTNSCFHGKRRKTGYIILDDVKSHGKTKDYKEFERVLEL